MKIQSSAERIRPPAAPSCMWLLAASVAGSLLAPAPAQAEGNAVVGKTLYERRCLGCHGDANTPNAQGPTLVGVVGRKAGTVGGATSRALSESGLVWDEATLQQFLAAPGDKVHGTIMPVGAARPQDREDLIAYLKSLR
ncbi:MAG TPA: c-type cytochrome [Burkholderiales bacterium]